MRGRPMRDAKGMLMQQWKEALLACFLVALPFAAQAQEPPPPIQPAELVEPLLDPQAEALPEKEVALDDVELTSAMGSSWEGTLMFSEQDVNDLLAVYRSYQMGETELVEEVGEGRRLEDFLNPQETEEVPEEILQLSLASIIYHTDADWTIWVNGKRYYRDTAMAGFAVGDSQSQVKVVDITPSSVSFVWEPIPASFSKVAQRWQEKQRFSDHAQSPQVAKNEQVDFNRENRTVAVTLRPNQTFVSRFMSVMEGQLSRTAYSRMDKSASQRTAEQAGGMGEAMPDGAQSPPPPVKPQAGATSPLVSQERAIADQLLNNYQKALPAVQGMVGGAQEQ